MLEPHLVEHSFVVVSATSLHRNGHYTWDSTLPRYISPYAITTVLKSNGWKEKANVVIP